MNSNLASLLLSSVMGWDYVGLNSERPELEFMGSMKYDAYDRFMPGTRFMSSLVQWLNQFDEEGIAKLVSLYQDDVKGLMDRFEAVQDAGKSYQTFTKLSEGTSGSVKFIFKSGEISTSSKE